MHIVILGSQHNGVFSVHILMDSSQTIHVWLEGEAKTLCWSIYEQDDDLFNKLVLFAQYKDNWRLLNRRNRHKNLFYHGCFLYY